MKGRLLAGIFSLALTIATAQAQYTIDWSKVAGGGGMNSTGGVYSLSGTIGQPDAGQAMTGGSYSLVGGFWSFLAALQTPNAPYLVLQLTATNTAILSWSNSTVTFILQQTPDVATPSWSTVTNAPILLNGTNNVAVPVAPGNQFFRLKYP